MSGRGGANAALAAYRASATEAEVQAAILTRLELLGYTVLETGRARRKVRCPQCGHMHHPRGWQGNTPGLPDLLVWLPARGAWLGIEVKRPGGAIRPEQAALAAAGKVAICRSIEDAEAAVCGVEVVS